MFVAPTNFLVGLYAYVRQAALSLDRTGSDFRQVLREYYVHIDAPSPERVIEAIGRKCRFSRLPVAAVFNRKDRIVANRVVDNLRRSLESLGNMLSDSGDWSDEEKSALRLELSRLESYLRAKLPTKLVDSASTIEHYNQSHRLQPSSISEISGATWPD